VIGTTLGNAALLAGIALGLNWILKTSAEVFEVLRWVGAGYLIWLGIQSWRTAGHGPEAAPPRRRVHISRGFSRRRHQSEDDRILHGLPPAVPRPGAARRMAACS
jgi:threonine/homoserine/homoserine lactone efflux protein